MVRFLLIFSLFILPSSALAADAFTVTSGTPGVSNFTFLTQPGSAQQGEIIITNTAEGDQEITLFMAKEGGAKQEQVADDFLFAALRFYTNEIPEDYKEAFDANKRNIDAICAKRDENADLDSWCDGVKIGEITLAEDETARVLYKMPFPQDAEDASAVLIVRGVAQDDATVVQNTEFTYKTPSQKTIRGVIAQMRLSRGLGPIDLIGWHANGFREFYTTFVTVENHGNQELEYAVDVVVTPLRYGEPATITQEGSIAKDSSEAFEHIFDKVVVPFFGSTHIVGQLRYTDENGEEVTFATEPARIFLFPLKAVIVGSVVLLILIALWFMRHHKRRKAKKAEEQSELDAFTAPETGATPEAIYNDLARPQEHADDVAHEPATGSLPTSPLHAGTQTQAQQPLADGIAPPQQSLADVESMAEDFDRQEQSVSPDATVTVQAEQRGQQVRRDDSAVVEGVTESNTFDLDWMGEDERTFDDEMRTQERKLNLRVAAFSIVFLGACALIVFLIVGKEIFTQKPQAQISIQELTEEDLAAPEEDVEEPVAESDLEEGREGDSAEEDGESGGENVEEESVSAKDIEAKVLNGGGATGAAGALTTELTSKGYTMSAATNANNSHDQTTLYFSPSDKAKAEQIAKDIKSVSPDPAMEENDSVPAQHGVDVVIVIGAQ